MTRFVALLSCYLFFVFGSAHASDLEIEEFTLDNGLRVVVAPLQTSKAVSHTLLIYGGAADDAYGVSGVAHYLEHLLFKGTPNVPDGQYSKIIERLGGQYNAFTSADMTGYYVSIASEHIDKVMELEADRMMHSKPDNAAYAKERDVVLEERRMRTDNNPAALLSEAMNAALFRHHPYRIPIIGWAHEIALLGEVAAREYLDRYYSPRNAALLLVGDITVSEARRKAQEHYGTWEGAPKAARRWTKEPPRIMSHLVKLHHDNVTIPRWVRRYVAPSLGMAANDNEVMPLILAEALLGNARTGWLYKTLVEQQKLATDVSVSYSPFSIGPATVTVSITPAKQITLEQIELAYNAALKDFLASELDVKTLQRTRNQLKAETIFARDSVQGMAFVLGQLVMIGKEPQWFNRWSTLVDGVTQEQIRDAVRTNLYDAQHITGHLLPPKVEVSKSAGGAS